MSAYSRYIYPALPSVFIWKWTFTHDSSDLTTLFRLLSDDERQRANKFKHSDSLSRYILSRAHVRTILGDFLKVPPEKIVFSYTTKGKPYLENHPIHFNLSHSGNFAVFALSENGDIGIDLEVRTQSHSILNIAKRFFSESEYTLLVTAPEKNRIRYFYKLWTIKEAYLKAKAKSIGEIQHIEIRGTRLNKLFDTTTQTPITDFKVNMITPFQNCTCAVVSYTNNLHQLPTDILKND